MKHTLYRAYSSILIIAAIAVPSFFVNAAAWFNTDAQDYPTFRVSNYTKNPNCSTCWSSSVSADAGDIVSFVIYYHNTSSDTATNVRLQATLPSGPIPSSNILGTILADNASATSGNVTLSLSSSQSLSFIPGSARWYPNQSTTSSALPSGQSGSEIVSGGLSIGSLAPGWGSQGYLTFRAQVSNASQIQGSAPLVSTNAASYVGQTYATLNGTANPNGTVTNVWFEYGTTQSLGNTTSQETVGSNAYPFQKSAYLSNLLQNTTYYYRIVAQNVYGIQYGSIMSFTTSGNPQQPSQGGSVPSVSTYSATSVGYSYATLSGVVTPNNSVTNAWFEYGTTPSLGTTMSPQSVGSSNSSTNYYYSLQNLSQNTTYYYRAVAQNSYGTQYGSIVSFSTQGFQETLSAPSVTTYPASSIGNTSATFRGFLYSSGSGSQQQTIVWFEYGPTLSFGTSVGHQNIDAVSNSQNNFSYSVYTLSPRTTYYYRAVAQNSYGTVYGTTQSFTTTNGLAGGSMPLVTTTPVTVTYSNVGVLAASINPNGALTNAWFEWGSTPTSLGNTTLLQAVGSQTANNDFFFVLSGLSPETTYYYRVIAQNPNGTAYGNTLSFTTRSRTQPVSPPTQFGSPQPVGNGLVTITPSVDMQKVKMGDDVAYTLTYRNGTASDIQNVVLKVILPIEVSYQSSNVIPAKEEANTLTFMIGTVPARSQGAITVKTNISSSIDDKSALIYGAVIEYTNGNGAFRTQSAYLTITAEGSILSFAAIGSAFNSIWTMFLILLTLIGALFFYVYRKTGKKPISA